MSFHIYITLDIDIDIDVLIWMFMLFHSSMSLFDELVIFFLYFYNLSYFYLILKLIHWLPYDLMKWQIFVYRNKTMHCNETLTLPWWLLSKKLLPIDKSTVNNIPKVNLHSIFFFLFLNILLNSFHNWDLNSHKEKI